MRRWGPVVAAFMTALGMSGNAGASVMIGNASTVVREVKSTLETRERVLIVDDDVFQDEEVTTGALSAARLIFKDGTNMSIGAQSRLKLTRVLFDPDPSKSKVAMRAAIGVFRMATGSLPSSAYQVATPVATISVRGTIIEFTVTGTGTTTVYVAKGAATVRSNNGDAVDLEAGQSTTVRAEGADGGDILAMSPTPPETPGEDFAKQMRAMTVNIRSEEPQLDLIPGGGGYNRAPGGPTFQNYGPPPPRTYSPSSPGGPGGPVAPGGPGGGSGTPQNSNPSTGQNGNPGDNGSNNGGNNGGGNGGTGNVQIAVDGPAKTRAGTQSATTITITRSGDGTGEILGTLAGANGLFSGAGSGPNGVRLLPGGVAQYTYVFTAPASRGAYGTALPYDFSGLNLNGTIDLGTQVVGPVFKVDTGTGTIAVPHAAGGVPFSHDVRLANETTDAGPIDLVGVTILDAYLTGSGSEHFRLSFSDLDMVLGAGEEMILTLTYDPEQADAEAIAALIEGGGELFLNILTDVNALFGEAGELFRYRLDLIEGMVIAAPGMGLAVLLFGGIVLIFRPRRQRH